MTVPATRGTPRFPTCPECGYELDEASHRDQRCPECGTLFEDMRAVARWRYERRMALKTKAGIAAMVIVGLLLFATCYSGWWAYRLFTMPD